MAHRRLSDLSALTSAAEGDLVYVVDISDTTDGADGTSKKITTANTSARDRLKPIARVPRATSAGATSSAHSLPLPGG